MNKSTNVRVLFGTRHVEVLSDGNNIYLEFEDDELYEEFKKEYIRRMEDKGFIPQENVLDVLNDITVH